jgi:hypothetical protein
MDAAYSAACSLALSFAPPTYLLLLLPQPCRQYLNSCTRRCVSVCTCVLVKPVPAIAMPLPHDTFEADIPPCVATPICPACAVATCIRQHTSAYVSNMPRLLWRLAARHYEGSIKVLLRFYSSSIEALLTPLTCMLPWPDTPCCCSIWFCCCINTWLYWSPA